MANDRIMMLRRALEADDTEKLAEDVRTLLKMIDCIENITDGWNSKAKEKINHIREIIEFGPDDAYL